MFLFFMIFKNFLILSLHGSVNKTIYFDQCYQSAGIVIRMKHDEHHVPYPGSSLN